MTEMYQRKEKQLCTQAKDSKILDLTVYQQPRNN